MGKGKWKGKEMLEIKERKARRRRIFTRDGWKCLKCSWVPGDKTSQVFLPVPLPPRYLTLDHIQPKSKGGYDEDTNLQTLCNKCNQEKGVSPIIYARVTS